MKPLQWNFHILTLFVLVCIFKMKNAIFVTAYDWYFNNKETF